ncbi:MAG: hypothetical protein EOO99_01625 [Pedobacter sp.]|nr:MAG: hypothetical protein EOO99_01625 [Pedobacter sp.]
MIALLFGCVQWCMGQIDTATTPKPTTAVVPVDTFYNIGKVEAKKAMRKSMFIPGWGQLYNYKLVVDDVQNGRRRGKGVGSKIMILGKFGGIYAAGYLLTKSYIDNNDKYKMFLKELQYRRLHNGEPDPDGSLAGYRSEDELFTGKAIYKNNREIVLISIGLTYGLNILDAFITARLNYINVGDNVAFKVSPTLVPQGPSLSYSQATPGLKMSFKF